MLYDRSILGRMRLRSLSMTAICGLLCIGSVAPAQTPTPNQAQSTSEKSVVGTPIPKDAQSTEILWPQGAPGAAGNTFDDAPRLWCYPANGPGPHTAVIVLPGGGYNHLVVQQEGVLEAHWLNDHNISAYVLQYRLSPRYLYPWAMVDGQRAIRFVRSHAKDWNLKSDAIGVWGFSAGGHLAGYLATAPPHGDPALDIAPTKIAPWTHDEVDNLSARPDFAILNYARLTIDRNIPGTFGMESITGPNAPQALNDAISPVLHVTKETSPSFIYSTEADATVNPLNATAFFNALQRVGVPAELHIFELGHHGTHMGTDQPNYPELAVYPILLEHWLQAHNWLPNQ